MKLEKNSSTTSCSLKRRSALEKNIFAMTLRQVTGSSLFVLLPHDQHFPGIDINLKSRFCKVPLSGNSWMKADSGDVDIMRFSTIFKIHFETLRMSRSSTYIVVRTAFSELLLLKLDSVKLVQMHLSQNGSNGGTI